MLKSMNFYLDIKLFVRCFCSLSVLQPDDKKTDAVLSPHITTDQKWSYSFIRSETWNLLTCRRQERLPQHSLLYACVMHCRGLLAHSSFCTTFIIYCLLVLKTRWDEISFPHTRLDITDICKYLWNLWNTWCTRKGFLLLLISTRNIRYIGAIYQKDQYTRTTFRYILYIMRFVYDNGTRQ